jgi:plastocyanin
MRSLVSIGCAALAFGAVFGAQSVHAATIEVVAAGTSFTPANVEIQTGDSVHWSGLLGGFHTVAQVENGTATVWNNGFHSAGGASEFTHTFDAGGTYHYICEPHVGSGMRGTIVVGPAVPAASEWGLCVLALAVLAVGTIVLRGRSVASTT